MKLCTKRIRNLYTHLINRDKINDEEQPTGSKSFDRALVSWA